MLSQIKDKLQNISLLLVLTSEDDVPGITMLLEYCQEIGELAKSVPEYQRLVAACEFLEANRQSTSIVKYLQEFATAASQLVENASDAKFPNENSAASGVPDGLSSLVDQSLLQEFVDSHGLMLEDFEAWLLAIRGGENIDENQAEVKRYIHTLKGDSGSIGLLDVEKVCHRSEDIIAEKGVSSCVPALLQLKEWVLNLLKQLTQGKLPVVSCEAVIGELFKDVLGPKPEKKVEKVEKTKKKAQHFELSEQYDLSGERDVLVEFVVEAEEHLNNVEGVILEAEGNFSKDAIDTIFRGVHSIKGGSAYFSIQEMTHCSHILENFLVEVRDGKRQLDEVLCGLLLTYIDLQKDVLARARKAGEGSGTMQCSPRSRDFLEQLQEYNETGESSAAVVAASTPSAPKEPTAAAEESGSQKGDKLNAKSFVKVETARLDHLVDSIGEMVIYSSMLIRMCRELLPNNSEVMNAGHRVEKFSRDLQDVGMSMRLVPIKGLFQKMSRLVWDVSKKLGKEVNFIMEGEDTELDRNLIDKLADPLMHMVRNSLDHGIETSEERAKTGKPKAGTVKLSAQHSGGNIHIRIEDDGRGINKEKVFAKAVEKGLVQPDEKLSESEIYQLLFAPGFSTAAQVTDISGRGVGMDVVRKNVESLRGRINIESKLGQGSVFTMELPLTLAIIDGIQIGVGEERFIIPSLSVVEFVRPKKEMLTGTFDVGETLFFRGKYLPIFRLAALYGIEGKFNSTIDATLVVLENHQELVALMVDDILGECSTVIKNLGPMFSEGQGLAGCAIMPRGEVALILDVRSLIKLAREVYSPTGTKAITSLNNLKAESQTVELTQILH